MFPLTISPIRKREGDIRLSFTRVSPLPYPGGTIEIPKKAHYRKNIKRKDLNVESRETSPVEWIDEALLPTIRLATGFGLLPVSTKRSFDGNQSSIIYKFRWLSMRTMASLFLLFCFITIEITALQYMVTGFYYSTKLENIELTTAGAAFYGYSVIATIIFFRLATRWGHLIDVWHHSEAPLLLNKGESPYSTYEKTNKGKTIYSKKQRRMKMRPLQCSLRKRFAILTGVVLSLALAEHLWHVILRILESWNEITACNSTSLAFEEEDILNNTSKSLKFHMKNHERSNKHVTLSAFHNKQKVKCLESIYHPNYDIFLRILENFSRRSHWFVYEQTSYAAWKGLALLGISFVATFIWNFTDLFIMIISVALTARFRKLNLKLSSVSGKVLKPKHWEGLRYQYALLSRLSRIIDDNINSMIFFSIAFNLYFICIQLLSGIITKAERTVDKSEFYFYSFSYLVGRAVGVILLAASINQETQNLPKHLYLCPHASYCKEVQRFMIELTTDTVALSGLNLFSITRNFLLGVAGAVVTYEIVLLQLQATNTTL